MPSAIWPHWLRLTRTHRVVIALAEAAIERGDSVDNIRFVGPKFKLRQDQFESSLADMELVSRMILQYSWEVFEDHCKEIIGQLVANGTIKDWKPEYYGCTEKWLDILLKARGRKWEGRLKKASLIEASTLRNALAHHESTIDQSMVDRLIGSDALGEWYLNAPIIISVDKCVKLRGVMQAYARVVEGTPPKERTTQVRRPKKNTK